MKKVGLIAAVLAGTVSVAMAGGEEIWMAKCKKCHGEDGAGRERALQKLCEGYTLKQLRIDEMDDKTDDEARKIIVEGKEKMPGYGDKLTAEEIEEVLAYSRELSKKLAEAGK